MSAHATSHNASRGYVEPMPAEDHFAQQFDMSDPENARCSYQRLMHEHTKQQFELATASSRRRSTNASTHMSSLTPESSTDSTSSTSS